MARLDPHSYADDAQPTADHLDWQASVDFPARRLQATATLRFGAPVAAGPLDLDTRDLQIERVTDVRGAPLGFQLHRPEPILGARLRIELPAGISAVQIAYSTSPDASALQWLTPAQTAGGIQPFLYTQCQPIHARAVVPLQDTPRTRLRYTAKLDVPAGLTALMAAEHLGSEQVGDRVVSAFRLPQPISPYLFAFAVGELGARELGPRTRVWAESAVLDRAAYEFAETEQLLRTGESLFGPYDWERYDMLVLPPAFPYGGMENPRLTFLTPSVLAGDRSLVAVVAHELAHSWTGNLVSNANAEHFWLNEGGATYAERRIVEAVWGPDSAALDWALGRRELDEALQRLVDAGTPEITRLRTELEGVDPDAAYTVVPYEKGALLFRALEQAVGRPAFDAFLRAYLAEFRFGALTTEAFAAFARQHLPAVVDQAGLDEWLYQPGLPARVPEAKSTRLDALARLGGAIPTTAQATAWSAIEWQLYLEAMPRPVDISVLRELDATFGLTASGNFDVLEKWLGLAIVSEYQPGIARAIEVLGQIGRMKYLRPIYRALAQRDPLMARALYERYAALYHPIARQVVAAVLTPPSAANRA